MTQSVINNLNKLEALLSSKQETFQDAKKNISSMDKSGKSFSEKLDKVFATINDIKNNTSDNNQQKIANFKEILEQTTDEANVETSLDLTLARDITEIISQLKEAVESTADMTEKTSDSIVENTVSEETLNLPTEELELPDYQETELGMKQEQTDSEKEIPFEQLLAFANKITESKTTDNLSQIENQELTNDSDSIKNLANKVIEFAESTAENIADEVTTSKQTSESQIDTLESLLDEDMVKDLKLESIKADTDTSEGSDFMQKQTPEENALKAMINPHENSNFELKIETVQQSQNGQSASTPESAINPSRILNQITKHLEGLQNGSKVNIVLNPESLGKVDIQLLTTKDGLTAQFTVTTQEARDLLMKGLDGLKDTLTSHGVGCDNISVKVSDTQTSEYEQDWTEQENSEGGNKEQKQQNRQEKEKGLFEKTMQKTRKS